ncbi:DUF1878 family protein [Robertmurraya sp. DFI.2.37]|jgi:hypothetical protein|uniref:DUF1878 family protein n=1 Tax=Robertmurraya sp. DFI.2.37 TaxID=3031819 RepID=UPI00124849D3|nr:DUF1878 family protein [Robertmurraya sp. DFI.2.37]MDF1511210.1 DUF1878 family protein [Robertmurraya sp. DFI.2.37]
MDLDTLLEKINRLEYHQSILLKMISKSDDQFYKLIVEKSLSKKDVEHFHSICEKLTVALEEQQEEGFVYFESLYKRFKRDLHPSLEPKETIEACLRQRLYLPLMLQLQKFAN